MMRIATLLISASALCACATTKASAPQPVVYAPQPQLTVDSPALLPASVAPPQQSASLWSNNPDSLFGDRRARGVGDILTVSIEIDDEADFRNSVSTDRQADQSFGVGSFFGLADLINDVLPNGTSLDPGLDIRRGSTVDGSGRLRRRESLTLTLAAQVVALTPNGDLAIAGYQDVQVDDETRVLGVSGIIRREDITRRNVITLDKIANAQVSYGGRGIVNRQTRDKIGNRVIDTVIPF